MSLLKNLNVSATERTTHPKRSACPNPTRRFGECRTARLAPAAEHRMERSELAA